MNEIWTLKTLFFLFFSFLLGGTIKGIIGTGLPTVALGLLTATIGLREGMAIIVLPSLLTNIEQGLTGGYLREVLQKRWSFLLTTFIMVWFGAALITRVNVALLSGLLGVILFCYAVVGLKAKQFSCPQGAEKWLNPLVGSINGLLTGLTGSSVVPGVLYLQSLNMKRDTLIQTMGLLFLTSTIALALALKKNALLSGELLLLSAIAFIPSYLGMGIGRQVRNRISEDLFKRLFFLFMLVLGLFIIFRSLW